jgi:hypothetical protein
MLSALYIGMSEAMAHHEEHPHEEHAEAHDAAQGKVHQAVTAAG